MNVIQEIMNNPLIILDNLNKLEFKLICDPIELDDIRIEFDNLSFLEK